MTARAATQSDLAGLPGADLIVKGLEDLSRGVRSVEALLVLVGRPRLEGLGFAIPTADVENPGHALYLLPAKDDSDSAHSCYNASIRRLVSFERAAECAN